VAALQRTVGLTVLIEELCRVIDRRRVAQRQLALPGEAHVGIELQAVEVRDVAVEAAVPEAPELAVDLADLEHAVRLFTRLPAHVELLHPEVALEERAQLGVAEA